MLHIYGKVHNSISSILINEIVETNKKQRCWSKTKHVILKWPHFYISALETCQYLCLTKSMFELLLDMFYELWTLVFNAELRWKHPFWVYSNRCACHVQQDHWKGNKSYHSFWNCSNFFWQILSRIFKLFVKVYF